ncbi:hypothetical protein AND_004398 [Anopheles darlingi]|uniref:Uncharacterized protein n=1 Tax=Anopheles darlingi TaxID=43151 RepID=W5JKN5_ANODA|nr:hypothetical protein AND_004398 [Anopheles darlingi]
MDSSLKSITIVSININTISNANKIEALRSFLRRLGERRQRSNVIHSLKIGDGEEIKDPKELIDHVQAFYKKLYSAEASVPDESFACDRIIPRNCEKNNNSMQEISYDEILHAIQNSSPRKSPGPDGLPIEFYRQTLHIIWRELTLVLNEARKGTIPESFVDGHLAYIPQPLRQDPTTRSLRQVMVNMLPTARIQMTTRRVLNWAKGRADGVFEWISEAVPFGEPAENNSPNRQIDEPEMANPSYIRTHKPFRDRKNDLETVLVGIHFVASSHHFINGKLKIRCTARIHDIYLQSTERSVDEDRPRVISAASSANGGNAGGGSSGSSSSENGKSIPYDHFPYGENELDRKDYMTHLQGDMAASGGSPVAQPTLLMSVLGRLRLPSINHSATSHRTALTPPPPPPPFASIVLALTGLAGSVWPLTNHFVAA